MSFDRTVILNGEFHLENCAEIHVVMLSSLTPPLTPPLPDERLPLPCPGETAAWLQPPRAVSSGQPQRLTHTTPFSQPPHPHTSLPRPPTLSPLLLLLLLLLQPPTAPWQRPTGLLSHPPPHPVPTIQRLRAPESQGP